MKLPLRFTFRWTKISLFALCGLFAASAHAAIAFDQASSSSGTNLTTLTWSHVLGSGSDRAVIVGISTEDTSSSALTVASVKFNGITLAPVNGSLASNGSTTINRSQLFYLLNSQLPVAGSYNVQVTFAGTVNGVSAGAISLIGVAQRGPDAVTTSTAPSGTPSPPVSPS